jgi:hypothetical protein
MSGQPAADLAKQVCGRGKARKQLKMQVGHDGRCKRISAASPAVFLPRPPLLRGGFRLPCAPLREPEPAHQQLLGTVKLTLRLQQTTTVVQ